MTLSDIEKLLGPGPVFFVPQFLGTKKPMMKWKDATLEETRHSTWIAMCNNNNTAVRLGAASGGLCAIDFDDQESFEEFLEANPDLSTTARWKGKRGCQIGIRILGEYPKSCAARSTVEFVETEEGKKLGKPLYEWRADGNLTTVRGQHPSGCEYQVLVSNPPAQMRFGEINWPEGWPVPGAKDPVEELVARYGAPWVFSKSGQGALNGRFFAGLFLHDNLTLFDVGPGRFYQYQVERGIWLPRTREEIGARVDEITEGVVLGSIRRTPDDIRLSGLLGKITDRLTDGAVNLVRLWATQRDPFARTDAVVHTQNVMVDLRTRPYGIHGFAPEWRSRNQCAVAYEAGARCPKWQAFLDHALPDQHDQKLLQHWGGLTLMQRNRCQVFLLLTGTGGGGKGTVVSLIRRLVGEDNVGELRTDHLAGRFEAGLLMSKTLLVGADVQPDFLQTDGASRLKAWTGGDYLQAEFKGRSETGSVLGEWNVVVTANSRLRVKIEGDLGAWSRRMLLLEFNQPKPEVVVPNYHDVLLREEGPGILNWFLVGAESLNQLIDGGKPFPLTPRQRQRVDDLLSESDSIRYFIVNHVRRSSMSADTITSEELFAAYLQMCSSKDWASEPQRRFERRAADLMLEVHQANKSVHLDRENREDAGKRGYRNVCLCNIEDAVLGEEPF